LEWLLVVAAVAGLAALAVVLVQGVVGGTATDVAAHSARQQAADLATDALTQQARAQLPDSPDDAARINAVIGARCRRLAVIYADIELDFRFFEGAWAGSGRGWSPTPACNLV
jgi:hypothetical protein